MDPDDAKDIERYIRDKRKAEAKNKLTEVAQLCNCIGEIYSKYGRYEDAIQEHTQERHLSEALSDKIGEAIACRKIGECHCSLGQYSEALELQKRHLNLARECGNHLEEQRAWATIGRTYLCQTETRNLQESALAGKKAEKAFVKALEMCEKVKAAVKLQEYMAMKGRLYLNLGHVFDARGDMKISADMMKRAITIAQKFKLEDELYMCNVGLATMYQKSGQYSQALRFLEVALRLADKLRDKVRERELFVQKAKVHVCVCDFLAAKHCLKKAHKIKVDSDVSEKDLINIFCNVNKMQEAMQDLETEGSESKGAKLHEVIADCAAELGNYKEAIENYLKVLQHSDLMSSEEKAAIYVSLAQTYSDIQQYDNAILYYRQELEERKDHPEQSCLTLLNIAELEELKGSKYAVVCKIYMSAFEAAKKAKHPQLQIQTLKSLTVLQKLCKQTIHLQETEKKLDALMTKYEMAGLPDSPVSDEVGEHKKNDGDDDGNLSLSDLTVSEESDGDQVNIEAAATSRKKSKLARRNEKGETPLHRACIDGNLKKVKSLIAEGHPVNPRDHCGWLPVHEACNHGHTAIVEYLLDCGAWINDRGGERCGGVTPLIDAANCGNLDIVRLLVDRGANLMAKDDDGNTALVSLQAWFSRSGEMLGAGDTLEYQTTEKLLLSKMGQSGAPRLKRIANSTPSSKPSSSHMQKINVRLPDLVDDDVDEDIPAEVDRRDKVQTNVIRQRLNKLRHKREVQHPKKREVRQPTFEDEKSETSDQDISEDESFDFCARLSPTPTDTEKPNIATQVYRSAIDFIGNSAQKRLEAHADFEHETKDDAPVSVRPALLSAEEDVGDTWLVDDMKISRTKKKSAAVTNLLTTSRTNNVITKKRSRPAGRSETNSSGTNLPGKRSKYSHSADRDEVSSNGCVPSDGLSEKTCPNDSLSESCPVSSSTEHSKPLKSVSGDFWDSDDDMLLLTENFNESDVNDAGRQNNVIPLSKTCDPTTRGSPLRESSPVLHGRGENYGIKVSDDSSHVNKSDALSKQNNTPEQDIFYSKTTDLLLKIAQACSSGTKESAPRPPLTAEPFEKATYKNSMRVKVKFADQTLLIPIQPSEQEKTISWLTLQARQRYFNMFLLLPSLTLSTQDGTVLCQSDIINTVLLDSDVLTANVSAWERPRLEERYEQACRLSLNEPNKNVSSALQQSENIGHLPLTDFGLGLSALQPVFQALEGQKTLTELRLNGNRLGDSGIVSLMKVLVTLPVLKVLMLDGNNISADGINGISFVLKSETCLQSLTTLSLSHNCLDDIASEPLTSVIEKLPELKSLNLSSCGFSVKVFTTSFCDALRGCQLEYLNIAENQIKDEGIKHLLKVLHPDTLISLNISHTRTASETDIGPALEQFVTAGCCLQELCVAGCYLSTDDINCINRFPTACKSLRSLTLSQNPNITNKTLQKLLYMTTGVGIQVEDLTARGCSIVSPLGSELIDAFRAKMQCHHPLKKFIFSCRGLTCDDITVISNVWKDIWKSQSHIRVVGMAISLNVV